jgi:hypothetical protein
MELLGQGWDMRSYTTVCLQPYLYPGRATCHDPIPDETLPADPTHRAFTVAFYNYLSSSSPSFPIMANPVRLMPGGLDKIVEDGFTLIGSGKVADRKGDIREEPWMKKISAEKLVYRIADSVY